MKAVLLGATKGIGRALARQMAERGEELFLLGRDATELARSAADLQIRGAKREVHFALCNLLEPEGFSPALHAAESQLGSFDTVVASLVGINRGATWSRDGFIYMARNTALGLERVGENGGAIEAVTELDEGRQERTHRWPHAHPDGDVILFRFNV